MGRAFKDYRTIWPVVFHAFLDWMVMNNFLTEDDFKNEHKYMSQKLRAKISFYDLKRQNAKNTLASITPMDIRACGDIKILLEILLENYFVLTLKVNGECLKFIGLDMKESAINSYSHILYDLKKMHNQIKLMNFMGIYYECKRQKQLIDDFKHPEGNFSNFHNLYIIVLFLIILNFSHINKFHNFYKKHSKNTPNYIHLNSWKPGNLVIQTPPFKRPFIEIFISTLNS